MMLANLVFHPENFTAWIVVGLVVGWLATKVMGEANYGLVGEEWLQLVDNASFVRGAHNARFGLTVSSVRYFGNFRNFRDGQYTFATDRPFDVSDPSTHPSQFVILEGGTTWDTRANVLGVFGQDSWRLSPRLALNYGVRYDTDDSLVPPPGQ